MSDLENRFMDPWNIIDCHGRDLPHWQQGTAMQFITFRLKDSLPREKLMEMEAEKTAWLHRHPRPWHESIAQEYHRLFTSEFEAWLDQGAGSCLFRDSAARKHLETALMHGDGIAVEQIAWVIMPNHVHVLCRPVKPLATLVKAWKGVSARRLGQGAIWQLNFRDTLIRNEMHFRSVVRYIRKNANAISPDAFTLWEGEAARAVPLSK